MGVGCMQKETLLCFSSLPSLCKEIYGRHMEDWSLADSHVNSWTPSARSREISSVPSTLPENMGHNRAGGGGLSPLLKVGKLRQLESTGNVVTPPGIAHA